MSSSPFPSDMVPMMISIPTARMIASFFKEEGEEEDDHHQRRVLLETLETSSVSQEVLENSDLEEALATLAWDEECGTVVRRILSRFFQISQGKMDPISEQLETGLFPHETPDERRKRILSKGETMEISNEDKEVVKEPPRGEPMELVEEEKGQSYVKVEEDKERSEEMIKEAKEDKKRGVEEEEKEQKVTSKLVKLDSLADSSSSTALKCLDVEKKVFSEKENPENQASREDLDALVVRNIELYKRQKEKEEIQRKRREEEEKEIKRMEKNPLRILVSKNFELYRKELERQKNSENKTNEIGSLLSPLPFIDFKANMAKKEMTNGFKEVKEMTKAVQKGKAVEVELNKVAKTVKARKSVSKVGKVEQKMNKVTKKVSKTDVSKKVANEVVKKSTNKAGEVKAVEQPSPAQILAKNLEDLSQQPNRVDVLALIEGLTPELLREAEKIVGREMGRVDLLWYEMTIRDFGKPKTKWLCDARDLYRGMAALAERKKQRMEEEAKQGILV